MSVRAYNTSHGPALGRPAIEHRRHKSRLVKSHTAPIRAYVECLHCETHQTTEDPLNRGALLSYHHHHRFYPCQVAQLCPGLSGAACPSMQPFMAKAKATSTLHYPSSTGARCQEEKQYQTRPNECKVPSTRAGTHLNPRPTSILTYFVAPQSLPGVLIRASTSHII